MKIKMTRAKAIIAMVLAIALVAFAAYVVIFGIAGRGSAKNITQGLDLKGGVSLTYQVDPSNGSFTQKQLSDTRYKLEQRVQQYSTEATASIEGTDRITVSIPGQYDADAVKKELGKPGELFFCTKADSEPSEKDIKAKKYVKVGTGKANNSNDQAALQTKNYDGYYKVWVTGNEVSDAKGTISQDDQTGASENIVSLTFNNKGAKAFGDMTSESVGKQTYIIYNNEVLSAPTVKQAITGGKAQIDGMESLEEAENLAANIRIGSLTLTLKDISYKVDSAQLGSDALQKSLMAGLIGLLIVIIFMIIVYRIPGIAAGLALISYVELILLALNAFNLTLTLPGIAGIILNIGMAVDANVIIYARIREEIAAGKTVKTAIAIGFKKAASAIVDGNVTTLIAGLVLLLFGSGTVKGFAQTLCIGIIIQLFAALVISRFFVWMLYHMGFKKPGFYGKEAARKVLNFVKRKAIFFSISAIFIIIGIIALVFNGVKTGNPFELSIEFTSGNSMTVEFNKEYSVDDFDHKIKPELEKLLGTSDVHGQQNRDQKKIYTIKTRELKTGEHDKIEALLIKKFDAKDNKQNFSDTEISSTVSNEMVQGAIIATIIGIFCMLIYIWIRFKNLSFATAAVVALIHDVAIVIGFYALARVTVGTTFIACILTIIGYSINATIVIFDRIRENMTIRKRMDRVDDLVNKSITQTLTRSIYTTFTTFITIFMIFIMGVSAIQEFTLPLMVGLIAGAWSSVFITGALWYTMKGRKYDKAQ